MKDTLSCCHKVPKIAISQFSLSLVNYVFTFIPKVVIDLYCFNPRSNSFSQSLCLFEAVVIGMKLGESRARGVPLIWIVGVSLGKGTGGEVSVNHGIDKDAGVGVVVGVVEAVHVDGVGVIDLVVLLPLLL